MKKTYLKLLGLVTMIWSFQAIGQGTFNEPEVLYYKFDQTGTSVINHAVPGGSGPATINGSSLTQSGVGQFGSALEGTGASGTSNYLATGYSTNLTGDWTMSFWLDMGVSSSGLKYFLGDNTANSFRCFTGGVAPAGGIVLRGGGLNDIEVFNVIGTGPNVITITYEASTGESIAYVNGVLQSTVSQTPNNTIIGSSLGVGSYNGASNDVLDGKLDEFRLYNRKLDASEISITYSQELPLNIVCGIISNVNFTNLTSSSFDVTWDHGTGNDNYTVEYGAVGFTQGSGTPLTGAVSGASGLESATGLSANTPYHVYITETCNAGADDFTVGPLTVQTLCGTEGTPWMYDVESATVSTSAIVESCWTNTPNNTTSDYRWNVGTGSTSSSSTGPSMAYSGSNYFYTEASSGSAGDTAFIATPPIDLSSLTNPGLHFYYHMYGSDMGDLHIQVSDNGGTSWTTLYSLLGEQHTSETAPWSDMWLSLNAYSGTVNIRFASVRGGGFTGDMALDDISVMESPTCLKPINLVSQNITSNSAELMWTDQNGATTWNIEYGVAGFTQGSGQLDPGITSNPYTVTMLPNTTYEFYVQSDCGGGDLSAWAGPFEYTNEYCFPVYTSTSEYLSLIETDGALMDVSHTATAFPTPNGYTDETAQTLQVYETLTFDLNTAYSPSSYSYVVRVWVDWNNNFVFDHPSEMISSVSGGPGSFTQQITVPQGTPVGTYRVRVRGEYGTGSDPMPCSSETWGSAADFTLEVVSPPSCLPPMDIDTVSVSQTSVELSWNELNTNVSNWMIEYGPTGFVNGNGTEVNATSNPFTVTGLSPSTNYDFYVRSDCGGGDTSYWRGPYTVYTDCGIAVAPFYEGFNNGVQPQCWENISSDPSSSTNNFWLFDAQGDYEAANNGKAAGTFTKSDGSTPNPDSMMLITPEIDISQLTTPYLSFEWYSNNGNYPGDNNPLIIEVFDGTSWTLLDTLQGDDPEWQFVNYDLSAYVGNNIQIRFMTNQTTTTNYAYYNDILLDEVRVDDCISLGGQDGSFDVCRLDDTVDLNNNIITKPNGTGEWSFPNQPNFLDDSIFNVSLLPAGSYEVYYVERYVCYDTTIATINVFGPSSAGTDGADTVCLNEPLDLYATLGGNVDLGGEWYDFTNTLLPNSQPKAQAIPGQYNYTYVADNGVCPADTAIVTIKVIDECDFLSVGDEILKELSIYPNPATSQLNIVNPSNASALKIEMLDMNGRTVLVENKALNNASEATLAIEHLEKGVYTLRVYNEEGQKTFKVVKQ